VHLPLIRRGLLAALALVFVDVMKEMPATLLLRPFGLNTLAVGVWQFSAESLWEEAAVPALAIVAAGLLPVAFALRRMARVGRELPLSPEA
jgi:iron(III) transport system permease protein